MYKQINYLIILEAIDLIIKVVTPFFIMKIKFYLMEAGLLNINFSKEIVITLNKITTFIIQKCQVLMNMKQINYKKNLIIFLLNTYKLQMITSLL